jgi:hypothetical protein
VKNIALPLTLLIISGVAFATEGYDGPAQLPQVVVNSKMTDSPAPGAVITVQTADDLKTALNNAQCGETIELKAGATFTGRFTVPDKHCNAKHWIIIRTTSSDSLLPAEGQRVTPCYAGVASLPGRPSYQGYQQSTCSKPSNVLAKIQMKSTGNGPFVIADGANFYRFIGLEITRQDGIKGGAALISLAGTADHIIVDRSWLHGNPQDETSNGFGASGGTYIAVIDSYLNDFHCIAKTGTCSDAHAVSGGISNTQDGPYKIQDNFLEASGEAVLFGGGAATLTPTDISIAGNHFFKPWQWMTGNTPFVGGKDGNPFVVKNHLELKNAVRVLAENNLMENVWGGFTQTGHALLLTPKSQHNNKNDTNNCPLCQVTDVTIRYTQISHEGGGIVVATANSGDGEDGGPALAGTRFSIHDVVIDDLNKNYGGGEGFEFVNGWAQNPVNTITINHVTVFPDPNSHIMTIGNQLENASMYGFVFTNNLAVTGRYPVWNALGGNDSCALGDVPVTTITNCFTSNTFQSNGLIASPAHYPPSSWPSGNYFPATPADVQFVNYNKGNGGNYQLLSGSPYKNAGTDGKDLGADIVGLNQAQAGVQ